LVVDDLTTVALAHLVSGDTTVRDVTVDAEETETLVGDSLEEGGAAGKVEKWSVWRRENLRKDDDSAPGSRTSENEAHLSRLQAAIELVEEVLRLNLERTGLGGLPELDERPEDRLLDGVGEGADHELREKGASLVVRKEGRKREGKLKTHLHSTVTLDVQLVPGDTDDLALEASSFTVVVLRTKV
jgi:hypothetical protein